MELHRAKLEPPARIGTAGVVDELGDEVNTERVDIERSQVGGEMPRSATLVEHGARSNR